VSTKPSVQALAGVLSGGSIARLVALPSFESILAGLGIELGPADRIELLRKAGTITHAESQALIELLVPPPPEHPPAAPAAARIFAVPSNR
jgi:hypothetical protein